MCWGGLLRVNENINNIITISSLLFFHFAVGLGMQLLIYEINH